LGDKNASQGALLKALKPNKDTGVL